MAKNSTAISTPQQKRKGKRQPQSGESGTQEGTRLAEHGLRNPNGATQNGRGPARCEEARAPI
jgi:hypothetical protein